MNINSFIINGIGNTFNSYTNKKDNRDNKHTKPSPSPKGHSPDKTTVHKSSLKERTTGAILDVII